MKYTFLLFLYALAAFPAVAQEKDAASMRSNQQLVIQYDDVSVGRNINLTYHRGLGKGWYLYGGFKYHINSKYYQNDWGRYTSYYKGTYAQNADENWGAKLGLEKMIWQPKANITFSVFYDLQFTRGQFDGKNLWWGQTWPNNTWGYIFREEWIRKLISFENNIGLVAHMKLSERLSFRLQAGIGLTYFITSDSFFRENVSGNLDYLPLPVSRMFSFGLEYNLHKAEGAPNSKKGKKKKVTYFSSITMGYDDLQTGRNFNIVYRVPLVNNTYIYGGLKLNMGSRFYSDYTLMGHNYYFKQFRPTDISQRFGVKAGIEHYIPLPNSSTKLFGFYDFQLMRATVKNLDTLYYFYAGDMGLAGKSRTEDAHPVYRPYGPVLAFENYAGAGLLIPLTDKLGFRIQGGIGLNYYLGPKNDDWGREWKADKIELSRIFGLGLQYNLSKKNN